MKIEGSFLDKFLNTELSIDKISPYFLNYNEVNWEYSNSGYFSYKSEEVETILFFVNSKKYGMSLRYLSKIFNDKRENDWYSLGCEFRLNNFIDAGDEYFVPKGTCISIEKSWEVICDYFENPLIKSNKIEWVKDSEIDWSELDSLY